MIKTITLQTPGAHRLQVFPTILGAMVCDEVYGIGPVKAKLNLYKVGLSDGKIFNSKTLPERNIVLHWSNIGFPAKCAGAVSELKQYFSPGDMVFVEIQVSNNSTPWETTGYVESIEEDFVSIDKNEKGLQLSIICPNPYLSITGTFTEFYGTYKGNGNYSIMPPSGSSSAKGKLKINFGGKLAAGIDDIVLTRSGAGTPTKVLAFRSIGFAGAINRIEIDQAKESAILYFTMQGVERKFDFSDYVAIFPENDWSALGGDYNATTLNVNFVTIRPDNGALEASVLSVTYGPYDITRNGV